MARKVECDRCGNSANLSGDKILPTTWSIVVIDSSFHKELCAACSSDLKKFLQPLPKSADECTYTKKDIDKAFNTGRESVTGIKNSGIDID